MGVNDIHRAFREKFNQLDKAAETSYAMHCIGLDYKWPYVRHGRLFYRPYRNYFTTPPNDKIWEDFVRKGYAAKRDNGGEHERYWLTRKGLDWLGGELGITIHDKIR